MSEPGIYSLLMEKTPEGQRSGVSALNFLMVFGGQALAAALAGWGVRHYGYRVVLAFAALAALAAGALMRRLAERRTASLASTVEISRT